MSIRTALIGSMLAIVAITSCFVGFIGVQSIAKNMEKEGQKRINRDLVTIERQYEEQLSHWAERVGSVAGRIALNDPELQNTIRNLAEDFDFTLLNICDTEGKPIAGSFPEMTRRIPIEKDPVIRRALSATPAWGTVLLDNERMNMEGGPALCNSVLVPSGEKNSTAPTTSALFWWAAYPIRDNQQRVQAIIYGGKTLNLNFELVDDLREMAVGTQLYEGKPLGTVTIFLNGVRVATNVLGPDRKRAVGTHVSSEVQQKVLQKGECWQARAWVVDSWYLSGYKPLLDPDGAPIGMLYAGLLEAPYSDMRTAMVTKLLGLLLCVAAAAIVAAILLVRKVTAPLECLSMAATELAEGKQDVRVDTKGGYLEVNELSTAFSDMQKALAERDASLQEQNQQLCSTNEKLEKANRNYMETLGFVTHELKSPLAAMQTTIDVVAGGYVEPVSEKTKSFLVRIKRNCEELQDMVKNYLDLSRAERGELTASKSEIDFKSAVVGPCVEQDQALFDSRNIDLEVTCPDTIPLFADEGLLRIALTNFLSNAAKYGREGGRAYLDVRTELNHLLVTVKNEGEGFTTEEGEKLFAKFSRLKNKNTRGKRGSGLGLFLCRQIVEMHDGQVWAESEPGSWASFGFKIPLATTESNAPTDNKQPVSQGAYSK